LVWSLPAGHPELTLRSLGVLLVRQDEPRWGAAEKARRSSIPGFG
jgi:hypothetical protein